MHQKKLRDFFTKNQTFKSFISGLDKKDERFFMNEMKCQKFGPGDRIVRKGSKDPSLFVVIAGKVLGLQGFETYVKSQSRANEVFLAGSVIGCSNMVFD